MRRPSWLGSERGLTLVEMLVAVAILAIAILIALLLYDAGRKSFKKGENVTEQQQAVRIAFDRLNADLRMAGYNTNPDGAGNRPDEQIEAAFDTAIVIRADFDAEDPALNATPETALATGGAFTSVSTGNDEIVVYALGKPNWSGGQTLTFSADVRQSPRDGVVDTVNIPNVALIQDDPPYTLYRITLNNNVGTWGSPGFIVRTPLVENVRSLTFQYFGQTGGQINSTFDLTSTADDIGGAETLAGLQARGGIRRVNVALEGLTRDPDLQWLDATDTDPDTRRFRKFELSGDVTPRNLGLKGIRDLAADVTPPGQPGAPTLYPGHCGGLIATWPANPSSDGVVSYRVNYGTTPGAYSGSRSSTGTTIYLSGLTTGSTYYVSVQATDAAGNISPASSESNATVADTTTPEAPGDPTATSDLNGIVSLSWTPTTENTSDVAGDPNTPLCRDLAGYRVYRSQNGSVAVPGDQYADESVVSTATFTDSRVVNCRPYHYRVTAVDTCGKLSDPAPSTGSVSGSATSNTAPRAPQAAQAFIAGPNRVRVRWDAVTEDVDGARIYIANYQVWRSPAVPELEDAPALDVDTWTLVGTTIGGNTEFLDNAAPLIVGGYAFYYRVVAKDDCPNFSEASNAAKPDCAFSGSLRITKPVATSVAGVTPIEVRVEGGTDTYVEAIFEIIRKSDGNVETLDDDTVDTSSGYPTFSVNWLANPPGDYTIAATVQNDTGCAQTVLKDVVAGPDVGCCLTPNPGQVPPLVMLECSPGTGGTASRCTNLGFQVVNYNCLTAVEFDSIEITWTNNLANNARLNRVQLGGSDIWVPGGAASPAARTFAEPRPNIPWSPSKTPVVMRYLFDKAMSRNNGPKNGPVTTTIQFHLLDSLGQRTAIYGSCGPATGGFTFEIPDPQ
jgi:prepilin-type N-terminal cleavage/methylation domain-containing protein